MKRIMTAGIMAALAGNACGQQIIDLGTLPGMTSASAAGISADGGAVAGSCHDNGQGSRAFRWTAGTGMVDLGSLPGDTNAGALGISADGRAITGSSSQSGAGAHTFLWTAADGMLAIDTQWGNSHGVGVSADGSIVAGTITPAEGLAYRWTNAGGVQMLGTVMWSYTLGMSADGSVVVGWMYGACGQRAFRWTDAGGMQDLGSLTPGFCSDAAGANADGSVVVGGSDGRAFRWTAAGGMQDLGLIAGAQGAEARAVSGDGATIVGTYSDAIGGYPLFLWTSSLGMVDLRTNLISRGVDLTGWVLGGVGGVSADGRAIAGYGTHNGASAAFVVYLGTPACYANCDGSAAAPTLNVNDFVCFLNKFAAGDAYANCDGSTMPPVLNVLDFGCFLNQFGAGCS